MFTVPVFFEVMQGASSASAGARLFPAVVSVAVAGLLGGYLTKRYPSARYPGGHF